MRKTLPNGTLFVKKKMPIGILRHSLQNANLALMNKTLKRIIAENIRRFRSELNITQKQLGLMMGYDDETAQARIYRYEKGLRTPNSSTLNKMAAILKKRVDDFHQDSDAAGVVHSVDQTLLIILKKSGLNDPEKLENIIREKGDKLDLDDSDREFLRMRREASKYGVQNQVEVVSKAIIQQAKKTKGVGDKSRAASSDASVVGRKRRKTGS